MTVIATGFEEGAAQAAAAERAAAARKAAAVEPVSVEPAAPAASSASHGPSVPPVFKVNAGMKPVVPGTAPVAETKEEEPDKEEPAEDPFDNIFKIFNTK